MDIKQNSTMIIALAIAVVVVMSVMVPVISDTIDSGSEGGGSSDSQIYTNTGDYYYRVIQANDDFSIRILNDTNNVVISKYDNSESTIYTIPKGDAGWTIPVCLFGDGSSYFQPADLVWYADSFDVGNTDIYLENDAIGVGEYLTMDAVGTNIIFTLYDDTHTQIDTWNDDVYGVIFDDGEWVYADKPIVASNSQILLTSYEAHTKQVEIVDGTSQTVTASYDYRFSASGTYSIWQQYDGDTLPGEGGIWWSAEPGNSLPLDTLTYSMSVSDTANGMKLDGITVTGEYAENGATATVTDTFTKFVVPKTVNTGGKTQAGWLTKDMPSDQITISCREVETGKMAVYYNQWDYYDNYPEPIYVQDMTENPILVLAIGETWAAYIDTLPSNLDDPYQGEQGKIRFGGGGYVFTFSLKINPNGTASYRNNAEIEGNTITKSDLIAYISPEGNLVPYYNENAPKSSTLYSYLSYANKTETANMGLNVIAMNGYENPTVNAEGFRYENDLEEYTVTASYTTSGDYVTGMNVTATYQSDSTEYSFPFTGQTPPEPYDMVWPDNESNTGVYSVAFSVVESGTEETSGGGGSGSLSPTLVTVLSIIPIMVLVGLVLMAVRSMKV